MNDKTALIHECQHWVQEMLRVTGLDQTWDIRTDFSRRDDFDAYASAVSVPQYRQAMLYFDFDNPRFTLWDSADGDLRRLVIHEFGHVLLSPVTKAGRAFAKQAGGKAAASILDDIEDDLLVSVWEHMPCWEQMQPYQPLRP